MELDEIRRRTASGNIRLSEALARALPKFRGLVADDILLWCSNELQGYANALEFYQNRNHELPAHRVVAGHLRVVHSDNTFGEISHQLANRTEYFLSAPLSWLEDFYSLPGDVTVVDLPELTSYIGRQSGGTIVCECNKDELLRILQDFNQKFVSVLDEVLTAKQAKAAAKAQSQWSTNETQTVSQNSATVPQAPAWTPNDYSQPALETADLIAPAVQPPSSWSADTYSEFSNLSHPAANQTPSVNLGGHASQGQGHSKFVVPTQTKEKAEQAEVSRLRNMQQAVNEQDPKLKKQLQLAEKKAAEAAAQAAASARLGESGQHIPLPAPPLPSQQIPIPAPPGQHKPVSLSKLLDQQLAPLPSPPAPGEQVPPPPAPPVFAVLPPVADQPLPSPPSLSEPRTPAPSLNRLSQLVPKPMPKPAPENNPLSPFAQKSTEQKSAEIETELEKAFEKIVTEPSTEPVQWPKVEQATMRDIPKPKSLQSGWQDSFVEPGQSPPQPQPEKGAPRDPWAVDEEDSGLASKVSFDSGVQLTIEGPKSLARKTVDPLAELMAAAHIEPGQSQTQDANGAQPAGGLPNGAQGKHPPSPVAGQRQGSLGPNLFEDMLKFASTVPKKPSPDSLPDDEFQTSSQAGDESASKGTNGLLADMLKVSQSGANALLNLANAKAEPADSAQVATPPGDAGSPFRVLPPGTKLPGQYTPPSPTSGSPFVSSDPSQQPGALASGDMKNSGPLPMMPGGGTTGTGSGSFTAIVAGTAVPFATPLHEDETASSSPSASGSMPTVPKPGKVPFARESALPSGAATPAPATPSASDAVMKPAQLFADMLQLSQFAPQLLNKSLPSSQSGPDSAGPDANKSGIDWKTIGKPSSGEPNITPVVTTTVKNRALQMMTNAYGTKDLIVSYKEKWQAGDAAVREQIESVLRYMIQMNFIRLSADAQNYVLTKEGVLEVEQSLAF